MKSNSIFACTNCGAQFQKWVGRCLECGKWGTIEKTQNSALKNDSPEENFAPVKTVGLKEIDEAGVARNITGLAELDRVLGGGLVAGSLILLGGEPGIGKSTLALQLAALLPQALYISGEESVQQIKLRADRMKIQSAGLSLANETAVENIIATIKKIKPALAVIDSIQTVFSAEAEGEPGNLNQVRACTVKILEAAKSSGVPIVLIGHVNKEGTVAGPKTLEHLVDTVIYLEGERYHSYRILRAIKNRFGPTDEVGVFAMTEDGLKEVANPSENFLSERLENTPGNVIGCLMEGTRPMLVEIQALLNKTVFGYPQRKTSGFDLNRLHVLLAVLGRRAGLHLEQYDVHLNVVGGLTADEPGADLAVALAVASAYKDKPLGQDLVAFGEIGLGGEVRSVTQAEKRIREAEKLGLKRVILPFGNKDKIKDSKLKIIPVKNISELITNV